VNLLGGKQSSWPHGDDWTVHETVFYSKRLVSGKINNNKLLQFHGKFDSSAAAFREQVKFNRRYNSTQFYRNEEFSRSKVHRNDHVKKPITKIIV